jgi:hypothetical protein
MGAGLLLNCCLLVATFETFLEASRKFHVKFLEFPTSHETEFHLQKQLFSFLLLFSTDRSFKSQCPTGFIREDTFKDIYSQFFPFGGSYNSQQLSLGCHEPFSRHSKAFLVMRIQMYVNNAFSCRN